VLHHFVNACDTTSTCFTWSDTWAYTWSWSHVTLRMLSCLQRISSSCCISSCRYCISLELLHPYCTAYWVQLLELKSRYDWQSISQYDLVSSPLWDLQPDISFVWNLLSCLCGAPSLRRCRVCLSLVAVSSNLSIVKFSSCQIFFFPFCMPHISCTYNICRSSQLSTSDHD
jgi:hypothetical protein